MVRSHHRFSHVSSNNRLTAASLKDCSNKCSRETYCNTFSYEYESNESLKTFVQITTFQCESR